MTVPLWSAVHGEMFRAGKQFAVAVGAVALQTAHHGQSHASGEIGVFTIGLLSASPSRVAEDIDVGSPERQSLIAFHHPRATGGVVFGTCLIAGGVEHLEEQVVVERCRHADGGREYGGETVAGYTMEGLTPPVKLWDAEMWDGG